MDLVDYVKSLAQSGVEFVASYNIGQFALRQCDRMLWVLEKAARWALPPPLDQDDKPQPELVRPLPWIFFLMLLLTMRLTREAVSIINLIAGKPPVRSADVVMYIQSKRRYIRALKYQGSRAIRARSMHQQSWLSTFNSLLQFTMCFRRQAPYANNNSSHESNEEIVVIKHNRKGNMRDRIDDMDRMIEKMIADLNTESDDDSNYTLTNATMKSETPESDLGHESESTLTNSPATSTPSKPIPQTNDVSQAEEASESKPLNESEKFIRKEKAGDKIANGRTRLSKKDKKKDSHQSSE